MREVYEGIAYGFRRPSLKVLIEQAQGEGGQEADDTS